MTTRVTIETSYSKISAEVPEEDLTLTELMEGPVRMAIVADYCRESLSQYYKAVSCASDKCSGCSENQQRVCKNL